MVGRGRPMANLRDANKQSNIKEAYKKFFKYIKKFRKLLTLAVIFSLLGSILSLVGPSQIKEMTDLIGEGIRYGIDLGKISDIAILIIIIYLLSFFFTYIQNIIMAIVTQKLTFNMRRDVSKKINRLPLMYFDTNIKGDTISVITNDIDMVGQTMNRSFSSLVSSVVLLIGSAIAMIITNPIMAGAGIGAAIIGFIGMIFIISKSQKYFINQQKELGEIGGHVEEAYGGHNVVKAYNATKTKEKEFEEINEKLYNSAWKSQFFSGIMMPLMMFIGNFAYVVVCIVGALLVMNGHATIGVIVAFMLYIKMFTQPLQNIAQAGSSIQMMGAACSRVFNILDEEEIETENIDETKKLENVKGDVVFENVKFGYLKDKTIINNFSANIKAGQKVAIVGPTGAGKTTIVNLLMRFYDTDSGSIKIDGCDIKNLTRENIRDLFAMVLQDTWIFEGSIRENLVYNEPPISDEALDEICKKTSLTEIINHLPKRYDTILDNNVAISAGQKQLMTIARAMIKNSPLLILDEATSSIDTKTEAKVQEAMDELAKGRTSFVIAHRLSTIKNADVILVMKDGDIIESGNHITLLEKQGFYADLYNSQFNFE